MRARNHGVGMPGHRQLNRGRSLAILGASVFVYLCIDPNESDMKRNKRTSRLGSRRKRNVFANGLFSYDKLEPKNLLAGITGAEVYEPTHIVDPFAQDAVTYKDMVARAAVTPYMNGELVVAVSAEQGPQFEQWVNNINWSQKFGDDVAGVNINSTRTMMTVDRSDNTSVALVHIKMNQGSDIFEVMRNLDSDKSVLWSSPNFKMESDPREYVPNDPQYPQQYHHDLMQNELAWDITLGSPDIIIGVTDDGVDLDHEDLAFNIWQNVGDFPGDGVDNDGNGYIDDFNGWDFIYGNNDPNPNSGSHGTHVAGIAAGDTDNGVGIAGTSGGSTILPLQFYDGGDWPATVINETFTYAADNGANIVNTSYNINGWVGDPVFTAGMQYMYDNDVLHFNSAGNGSELNPARQAFEQSILVASTGAGDIVSSFTNYGTGIDIAAPGGDVLSTLPGTYGLNSGTSMAAPNAAGVAGLIWSANPTWNRDQVAAQLLATGDNIDSINPSYAGFLGGGRVNSFAALTTTLDAPQVDFITNLPEDGVFLDDTTISQFAVAFNQVMDPASINAGVVELRNAGTDDVFGTADDVIVNLDSNDYLISTNQLVFNLVDGPMNYGHYQLTISGSAENPFGDGLDGNGDGTGGDAYVRDFHISPPVEGIVSLDRGSYLVEDTIGISIGDANATGPLTVQVTTSAGDSETVTLTNTGFALFQGSIDTVSGSVVAGDGTLQVALGHEVTVTYMDSDNGSGGTSTSSDTAAISNVLEFVATDTPLPITDNSTTTSIIPISFGGTVNDLDLLLDLDHTYDGDLIATLTSPSGTEVTLFSRIGGTGENFNDTYFDDEAKTPIGDGTAPYTGNFQPAGSFSNFDFEGVTGNWTLTISDNAGADQGVLNAWSLFIDVTPATIGRVALDANSYNDGDTVEISVFDENAVGPVTVDIVADSGDMETVTLSGSNGVYTGSIGIAAGTPASDGMIQADIGQGFTVTYVDTDDGQGNTITATDSAFISNIFHYPSVDIPITINDNTTFTSEIVIADSGTVADVNVQLDITHTFAADLEVFLIAPDGTRVELFTDVGGGGDNFVNTILDDDADVLIVNGSAPFTGTFAPEGDLTQFEGVDLAGTWLLEVSDDAGADQGTLDFWCLLIDVMSTSTEPSISVQSDGQIAEGDDDDTTTTDFVITLSAPSTSAVTVSYGTTTASATFPATPGVDFAEAFGSVTFLPGETTKTISVDVYGDRFNEVDEEFGIELSNASGGQISFGEANVVITDNDGFSFGTPIDFGIATSDVDQGSIGFLDDAYSADLGMGWTQAIGLNLFNGGRGDALVRDGGRLRDGTFVIDVPNGDYMVTAIIGVYNKIDPFNITVEGTTNVVDPPRGPNIRRTFMTTVSDGQLTFQIDGGGGLDNTTRISGLIVDPASGRSSDGGDDESSFDDDKSILWRTPVTFEWTGQSDSELVRENFTTNSTPGILAGAINPGTDRVKSDRVTDQVFEDESALEEISDFEFSI